MRVRVIERSARELKMVLEGEGHTFCNVLQSTLLADANVDFAGYSIPHPLKSEAVIYVRVKKGSPKTALSKAADIIKGLTEEFQRAWVKATET
jgi:DNA-directed RNA polymerase subunit L